MAAPTKAELQARVAKLERALARERKRKGVAADLVRARAAQAAAAKILRVIRNSPSDVRPVFEAIADAALRLFGAWSVIVVQFDGSQIQYGAACGGRRGSVARVRAMFPLPLSKATTIGPVGRCIISRKLIELTDARRDRSRELRALAAARGFRSTLAIPFINANVPIGAIGVTRVEAGRYTRAEIDLLRTFTDQAVIAVENTRRFHETREALERQTATADILKVISGSPDDVQPVFDAVAHSSMRLLGALSASVSIRVGDTLQLGAFTSTSKTGDQAVKDLFPLSLTDNRDTILAKSVLKAVPAQVGDAQGTRRRPRLRQIARRRGFQSIIAVPMLSKGSAIGTVSVTRREAGGFSDHEVELLTTFADQAVIAIENVRLFNETQETLERQTATSEILKVIAGSPSDVRPVFDAIVDSAAKLFRRTASLRLVDDGTLRRVARSAPLRAEKALPERMVIDRDSLVGQVALEGRAIQVPDLRHPTAPAYARKNARKWAFRSSAVAPLLRGGRAIGVIAMTSPEPGALSDKQMDLLSTFADQAVIAIENARLFNETKEALEHQTATSDVLGVISTSPTDVQPVLDAIAESAVRLCESSDAQVLLCADGGLRITAQHGSEIRSTVGTSLPMNRESATARAVIDATVVHVADVAALPAGELEQTKKNAADSGWQSILSVPLLREGTAVGAIAARRSKASPFTPRQIALLKTFADQAVIAIENVRLFNETKEALERQTATAEILKVISDSPTDVQPVLEAVAERAAHLCAATDAHVWRREGDALQAVADYGGLPIRRPRMAISRQSVMGRVVIERGPVHVLDLPAVFESEFPDSRPMLDAGIRTVLGIPLLREGTAIGAILIRRTAVSPFSDKQIALLRTFADQAVIAIENVRLFNETKEALEQQTASAEILRTIASAHTDAQPVFQAIIDSALSLCDAVIGVTFLFDGERVNIAALAGFTPEAEAAYRGTFPLALTRENITTRAIIDRKRVHVPDIEADETFPVSTQLHESLDFRAVLAVPMLRDQQCVGVITVARRAPGPFSDRQTALLESFADQAVIAIENVRLFNETKEALEQQTASAEILRIISESPTDVQPVFDAIARTSLRLFPDSHIALSRAEEGQVHLKAIASPDPDGAARLSAVFPIPLTREYITGTAILECRTISVSDTTRPEGALAAGIQNFARSGFRANTTVPMVRNRIAIGALSVVRSSPGTMSENQVALLRGFADQAVIAIENVRLFNETKEALERQTATAEILRVISSSPTDVQPVFDMIGKLAGKLCAADISAVARFDGEKLQLVALEGVAEDGVEGIRRAFPMYPGEETVIAGAFDKCDVEHVADVMDNPSYARKGAARAGGYRGCLGVPMIREGSVIGVIFVARVVQGYFADSQVTLLKTFADQAVIAIENVRLFNETKEALERQTATAEILEVMSRSQSDLQPVFDTIAGSAMRLCDGDQGLVYSYDGALVHIASLESMTPEGEEATRALFPMPASRGFGTGRAILTRAPVQVADVFEDPEYEISDTARVTGWRSVLAVPMLRAGTPIGAIAVVRRQPMEFTESQVALLKTFADQAVIAIENVRLFNETNESLERQTATADILKVISSSPTDVQPVFEAIVASAARLCDAVQSAAVTREDGMLHLVAHRNWTGEGRTLAESLFPMPVDQDHLTAIAVRENRVLHSVNLQHDPEAPASSRELAIAQGYDALLIVPMLREGRSRGAVVVARKSPFSDHQIALLQTFADQAVIAIDNVRLFNETREALERQTATAEILKVISSSPTDVQPVFDAVAESSMRLLGALSASVTLRSGDQLQLAAYTSINPSGDAALQQLFPMSLTDQRDRILARAVLSRAPVAVSDTEGAHGSPTMRETGRKRGYRSLIAVPMLSKGESIGTIAVTRREAGEFSDHDVELLATFAHQAVIAIDNVRLFNETREALERQTATAEILRVISTSPNDVQPVFDAIVANAARLCDAAFSAVARFEGGMLHLKAVNNMSPEEEEAYHSLFPRPPGRQFILGRAFVEGQPVHIEDIEADPEYEQRTLEVLKRVAPYRTYLGIPIIREGVPIGVIGCGRREIKPFTPAQIALVKTFADQAVIAIENVRLFNETKESLERQTATAEILKVISSSPTDVQPVLETVAEYATRLCEADRAFIFRFDGEFLRSAVTLNASPDLREFVERNPIRPGNHSATARAGLEKRTIHIPDVAADPNYSYGAKNVDPIRTVLTVPMLKGDELLGVILTYRLEVKPFTEKQIALIETFADQAVIAIENVRLFNETKEALEQQRASGEVLSVISNSIADAQPVFEKIVESCERLFSGSKVGLNLVGPDGLVHAGAYGKFPGVDKLRTEGFPHPANEESATGAAILARDVIHYPDVLGDPNVPFYARRGAEAVGFRSFIMAPLLSEGRGLGAIFVGRDTVGTFTEKEITLLKTFANQAVIAIQNARLFNETKEALERQTATADILKVISESPTDVQPVFDAITRSGVHLFKECIAGILMREGDQMALRGLAGPTQVDTEAMAKTFPIPFDPETSLVARTIASCEITQLLDSEAPDAPEYVKKAGRAVGFRSLTAAPLIRDGVGIGAISIASRKAGFRLSEKQVSLLRTFADQAVIAIENVRLFKEIQQRTEALSKSVGQLTALGEVSQALSSTLDLEKVLQTIVARAVQLTGLDGGAIYEYDDAQKGFYLRGAEHMPEEAIALSRSTPMRLGEGAIGRAGLAGEAVQIPDILEESYQSRVREFLIRSGSRAVIAVPLLREGKLLGALAVTRNRPGAFAPEILELLKTFATQSAIAIQNARLFREIEEKGRELELASQHKSQFLASMSHELRTPLNAILGFNEMILGEVYGEVPADMKEPLEDIQTSGKHLLRLINNVLDLAKIEAGRMELALADYSVHDMVESVRTTLRPLAEAKGLEFLASVPNDLPLAHGDSGRLTQCLMNLAGNSLKFTKEGNVSISVEPNGETLAFRVTDTGIGIPPDKIDNLFTEFKQTDATIASEYGGTGLGLSITKKFIEMHGGRIWVESELGKGSSFIFEIPLHVETGAAA